MPNPPITIITVTYNAATYLSATILSVASLAYTPLEYLVIDGGSTDGTVELLKKSEDVVTGWVSEADQGVYDAMNKGWRLARDDSYILFLGAGDRILSLPSNLERYSTEDAVCGRVLLGEDRSFTPRLGFHLKIYNGVHHQALLVKKVWHPRPPFALGCGVYADFDFNQRLLKSGICYCYCPEFVSYALPGGISDHAGFMETLPIIRRNFGLKWVVIAVFTYGLGKLLPVIRKYGPLSKKRANNVF